MEKVYGRYIEKRPVMLELMASVPMQRLKGLNQFGLPDRYYHLKGCSRFDHSLGVMLLLRLMDASEEEQIAGLLHDVSHRAFSHIYDWVVGTAGKEDSQDNDHDAFIRSSTIPSILNKHGYSVDRITNYHLFGLLERDSPNLCADRIDYILREIESGIAKIIFKGLVAFDGMIVCKDFATAQILGRMFLSRQIEHWGGREAVSRYFLFSSLLRKALEMEIIKKSDFLFDDEYILSKLEKCSDKQILNTLNEMRKNPLELKSNGPTVKKKFRFIDPPFISKGKLVNLTDVDSEYSKLLENAKRDNQKGISVPQFS